MMIYYKIIIVSLIGVLNQRVCSSNVDIAIETESMTKNIKQRTARQHASGYQTVHLYKGDTISTEICLNSYTELTVKDFRYSNDGGSDRIRVSFDMAVIAEFDTVAGLDNGQGWEKFRTSLIMYSTVDSGRHILTVTVIDADPHGVEVDAINIQVNNSQSVASVRCQVFCFDEIGIPYSHPTPPPVTRARAVQMSTKTNCAEEDNVNIPVFHDSLKSYVVTASLPKYPSFENNRGPDWRNCKMVSDIWKYTDVSLSQITHRSTQASQLTISPESTVFPGSRIALIEVDFDLEGPSTGSMDSEVGTNIKLNFLRFNGTLSFQFQYYNRYNTWSQVQHEVAKTGNNNVMFETPDFSFREGPGNKLRIEVFSDQSNTVAYSIGEFFMKKRQLKPDKTTALYKDSLTVVESVSIDMWWRVNETMTVTILNGTTVNNAAYMRIYRRVPWVVDGFSQVFVMYQDGNVRLLPVTPHGLDWIPFGSSFLIGQSNYSSLRPCSPIKRMLIDPHLLTIKLFYADGGFASVRLVTTLMETQLHISDLIYANDAALYPFFTLRSMYVSDGNCDVDQFNVEGQVRGILDPWGTQYGNFFAFYRKCISMHNTQSPDITLRVTEHQPSLSGFLLG